MIDKDQLQEIVEHAVRKAISAKAESTKKELIQLDEYIPQVLIVR